MPGLWPVSSSVAMAFNARDHNYYLRICGPLRMRLPGGVTTNRVKSCPERGIAVPLRRYVDFRRPYVYRGPSRRRLGGHRSLYTYVSERDVTNVTTENIKRYRCVASGSRLRRGRNGRVTAVTGVDQQGISLRGNDGG